MHNDRMCRVLQILETARDLIADRERWIKGEWVRYVVNGERYDQPRYCAVGSIYVAGGFQNSCHDQNRHDDVLNGSLCSEAHTAVQCVAARMGISEVEGFNDNPETTHEDVVALFDLAVDEVRHEITQKNR